MSARPSQAYVAARERIDKYVAELARDREIGVMKTVDSDNGTFLEDDAFLGVFLLPQIETAIEELAG